MIVPFHDPVAAVFAALKSANGAHLTRNSVGYRGSLGGLVDPDFGGYRGQNSA